jgi:DNA-binding CsgD family transcriptional regulator/DNA-binding transcriptional ArsR family regulator
MTASPFTQNVFMMDATSIQRATCIYRAVNHSLRLQIIETIHRAGTIHVTTIIQTLKFEQPVISAHLKILREAKIVSTQRKGSNIFYSINYFQLNRLSILAERLVLYRGDTSEIHNVSNSKTLRSKEKFIPFTPTELKVIQWICQQDSNEEIAQKLGISKLAVEDHRSNIINKMKVRNSVGILFFAIKKGLFKM